MNPDVIQPKAESKTLVEFIHISVFDSSKFGRFDGSEVVVTPEMVLFWKPPNPFGQWTDSEFELNGKRYLCAEQYMMAEKARLFGDLNVERQILESTSPRQHKKLGRKVKNFDNDGWVAARCDIVRKGNIAKFSQNGELRQFLIETGERRLVEASPLDKIWGIGFAADHPNAYDPEKWTGLNLLGDVLEDVRAHLMHA